MATTSTQKKWKAMHRNGSTLTFTCDNAKRTGSGTYFYNGDNHNENQVAAFGDGDITSFYPEDTQVESGTA